MLLACNMILSSKSRKILKEIKRIRIKLIRKLQRFKQPISDFGLKSSRLNMRIDKLMERLTNNVIRYWDLSRFWIGFNLLEVTWLIKSRMDLNTKLILMNRMGWRHRININNMRRLQISSSKYGYTKVGWWSSE